MSSFRGYFGVEIKCFDCVLELSDVILIMEKNMEDIVERKIKLKKEQRLEQILLNYCYKIFI